MIFDDSRKNYFALCTFTRGDLKAFNCVLTRGKGLLIVIRLIGPCDYSAARGPNLKTHDQRSYTLERPITQTYLPKLVSTVSNSPQVYTADNKLNIMSSTIAICIKNALYQIKMGTLSLCFMGNFGSIV